MRDEEFGLRFLEEFQDRLMYDSDTINKRQIIPLAAYLDKCAVDGLISRDVYEKVCFKNAQRLLGE